jgi:hypothetical protein
MMLVSLLSYSQYPTTKIINGDTIVMMTLKQGEDINKRFVFLNDSIKKVNTSFNRYMVENGQRLQKVYTDYNIELNNHRLVRAEADSFKTMYLANRKIYLNAEQDHKKEIRRLSIITFFTMFMTAVFASQ